MQLRSSTPTMQLQDCADAVPLPTDGMEVEEVRDADTVRLFMLEWRRRLREQPAPGGVRPAPVA